MQYWSQFINHEIRTVKGIKWYISNVLVRCGFIASIDEVAKCKNYVDHEAVRIYQSCYQDTKYSSFTIKDYEGHDNLNGLTGVISSYDCVRHQYNIIIKGNQGLTQPEYRWALSPGVLEPTKFLRKELNSSTYHLSRGSICATATSSQCAPFAATSFSLPLSPCCRWCCCLRHLKTRCSNMEYNVN